MEGFFEVVVVDDLTVILNHRRVLMLSSESTVSFVFRLALVHICRAASSCRPRWRSRLVLLLLGISTASGSASSVPSAPGTPVAAPKARAAGGRTRGAMVDFEEELAEQLPDEGDAEMDDSFFATPRVALSEIFDSLTVEKTSPVRPARRAAGWTNDVLGGAWETRC